MNAIKKYRTIIILVLILATAICIGLVGLNAYSSQLQYDINNINSELQKASYKIANLQVKIQSATNVSNLEDRALEMGLVYPEFDNIVYVHSSKTAVVDFATALRQNVYE